MIVILIYNPVQYIILHRKVASRRKLLMLVYWKLLWIKIQNEVHICVLSETLSVSYGGGLSDPTSRSVRPLISSSSILRSLWRDAVGFSEAGA